MTYRPTTSRLTSERFAASYTRSNRRPKRRGRVAPQPDRCLAEIVDEKLAFREMVLSKIGRLTPRHVAEIVSAAENDWGQVNPRRVDRALSDLVKAGTIERTPDGYLLARRAA